MTIKDLKLTENDFVGKQVTELADRPSEQGVTASALKAMFVAPSKNVVAPAFNKLIEYLSDSGADGVGVESIEGLAGYTVQEVLQSLKTLVDSKVSDAQHTADLAEKLDVTTAGTLVQSISFNESNGKFTFTKYDGSETVIDTALEKIALNARLENQQFVLTLIDGTEQRVDLSEFLTQYEAVDSDQIAITINEGKISATLLPGAVRSENLGLDIGGFVVENAQLAEASAAAAAVSEQNARYSELSAADSASRASGYATSAENNAAYVQSGVDSIRESAQIAQNNADRVINTVSGFADEIVSRENEQPTSEYNRLWFPGVTRTVEIVTSEDVREEVTRQVAPGVDDYLDTVDFSKYTATVKRDANGIYFED